MSQRPPELHEAAVRAARDSLAAFTHLLWPIVNPGVQLVWGRHLTALVDHLEAVTERIISWLGVNIPPGYSKSTLANQMWPCWEWLRHPERRWIFCTNALTLATSQARYRRQIVTSERYQALGPDFTLPVSGRAIMCVVNSRNGSFQAYSTGSTITGQHADTHVIDDPHPAQAVSPEELRATCQWHDDVMSTRVRDGWGKVLIMQRLGEGDLSGHLEDQDTFDAHIRLPALYDPELDPGPTPLGWSDWRTEPGELLYPERFGRDWVDAHRTMGTLAFNAQMQQNVLAREGNLFRKAWWLRHESLPKTIVRWVAAVDVASAEHEDADQTVMQIWALGSDGIAYLAEQVSGRWAMTEKLKQAAGLASRWPLARRWLVERRGEAFAFIDLARRELPGRTITPRADQEPKDSRIMGISPHVETGQVSIPQGPSWADAFIDEAAKFPRGKHDDQLDCAAYALRDWARYLQKAGPITSRDLETPDPPPPRGMARTGASQRGQGYRRGVY